MFKKLAIATAAVALTASAAAAGNFIKPVDQQMENASFFELPLVRAEGAGIVQIESLQGDVLAQAPVNAGVNTDVKARFGISGPSSDVVAKLIVHGAVTDTLRINVDN
ncbi:MAG: hypothetical protein AAF330_00480 [Pseudomonadota bacterium]